MGDVVVRRAYYYCRHCRTGDYPWDQTLGLGTRQLTPTVEEMVALAGVSTSFAVAQLILDKVGGLTVAESTVERITEDHGAQVAQAQSQGRVFGPEESWPLPVDNLGKRCGYVGIDGIYVRMQGPKGAAAESKIEYVGRLYVPPELSADGRGQQCYVAARTLAEATAQLQRHAQRVSGERVTQWLCVTDGGAGLRSRLETGFCFSTWILDYWHAAEYLKELAQTLFPDSAERAAWTSQWCHDLKHEGGTAILKRLQNWDLATLSPASQAAHSTVVAYYSNQLAGMDYPQYLANGWQIGSGPTEGTCRVLVADRLKHSGMRWSLAGSHNVSTLRALLLNGESTWNHYWSSRKIA